MGTCCAIVSLIVVGYIVIQIAKATAKSNEEKNRKIESYKRDLYYKIESLKDQEKRIYDTIKSFFVSNNGTPQSTKGLIVSNNSTPQSIYDYTYNVLCNIINGMQSTIAQMKEINNDLVREFKNEIQIGLINQAESTYISKAKHITEGFRAFGYKVYAYSSMMMDESNYGKINKAYWDSVCAMERYDAVGYISRCEYLLGSSEFDEIYAIDIEKVIECVWFFATEKTFSASDFQKVKDIFYRIHNYCHADLIIADLYTKKKLGGEDVLRDPVRDWLKTLEDSHMEDSNILTLIASGLMWMNAYQAEQTVLQYMLTAGKEMTVKTQERLHSLTNGGGQAPSSFDVKSSIESFYFDVSALAWKDDEYIGLFENLAFQDKTLTYSLALRDENKDLFIPQGINIPNTDIVLNKFKSVFAEEYDSGVEAQTANCIALSGNGEEKMNGILVSANECKQMGILIHIAKIGKKLIIKFYTLFMPSGADLAAQKQQALSMYKKLSPSVTMWESSLKDTILMAVEQLLNATAQGTDDISDSDTSGDTDEPIF